MFVPFLCFVWMRKRGVERESVGVCVCAHVHAFFFIIIIII